jgi:acyl-homoserine-lactone acylase
VSGTSFLGVPVILIGFNQDVAWSHTVSAARRFGLYQLSWCPDDATSYLRDGQPVKMQARTITVNVKQASGVVAPVTRTLYTSVYGPLVNLGAIDPALAWSADTAFAIRDINADNYRTFRTWLRWGQARSLDELMAAQREEASIPWVNTVAVGRGSAKAWYADIGAVPNVSPAQVKDCTTPAGRAIGAAMPRVPVFDGAQRLRLAKRCRLGAEGRHRRLAHAQPAARRLRGEHERQPLAGQPEGAAHGLPGHLRAPPAKTRRPTARGWGT